MLAPLAGLRNLHESHESYTLLEMGTSPFLDSVRCASLVRLSDARPFGPFVPAKKGASLLACSVSVHCWTDFKAPLFVWSVVSKIPALAANTLAGGLVEIKLSKIKVFLKEMKRPIRVRDRT